MVKYIPNSSYPITSVSKSNSTTEICSDASPTGAARSHRPKAPARESGSSDMPRSRLWVHSGDSLEQITVLATERIQYQALFQRF